MDQAVKQSLITRSGIALGVLVFVSVLNMVITFLGAEHAENDAVRINLAGSLRMQSYRIAEALLLEHGDIAYGDASVHDQVVEFERRFYRPVLAARIHGSNNDDMAALFERVEQRWLPVKAAAESPDPDLAGLLGDIDALVDVIERLVKMLETETESTLRLLRTLQGVSMLITIVIVVVILWDLNSTVVTPLRQLVVMANKLRGRDFSMRLHLGRDDELALLSDTFNTMAASLQAVYSELEDKVQEKTRHLEQARDELGLLYETSRSLGGVGKIRDRLDRVLGAVQRHFDVMQVRLESGGGTGLALAVPRAIAGPGSGAAVEHRFSIERLEEQWGELVVTSSRDLPEGQARTLQLVAANIAAAFSAESRHEQQHRLVLMEERTAIARELHDSLAQTLSYLKIQVSRLQMLQARGVEQGEIDTTLGQIKGAISSAYVQLRELLSTFRLQLSSQGLHKALEATVEEFSTRAALDIDLDYQLGAFPLSPNEEIHILQIVREALSNVVRHSRAAQAVISAVIVAGQAVEVRIVDDGIGFGKTESGDNHFGKVIMQERARSLDGEVYFANVEAGGAQVTLRFVPAVFAQATEAGD